jgi:UDP-glucose 4-epimerase
MIQKALVTGAAGFIGSHLCHRLIKDGVPSVIGIDNLRSGDWSRTPIEVQQMEQDIGEFTTENWKILLDGVDVVFHLAAEKYNSSRSTPEKLLRANVLATERLMRAAALAGVARVVFTSSLYAYGSMGPSVMCEQDVAEPSTLYGASKLMGEGIARSIDREIGLSWNVARLFFIYGPRQFADGGYKSVILSNFERILRGDRPTIYGDGLQALDYVYVDDCVDALILLATSPVDRKLVNVSSGFPTTVNELTSLMEHISSSGSRAVYLQPDWTHGSQRFGEASLIESTFGWQTKTPLDAGLTSVFNWLKDAAL